MPTHYSFPTLTLLAFVRCTSSVEIPQTSETCTTCTSEETKSPSTPADTNRFQVYWYRFGALPINEDGNVEPAEIEVTEINNGSLGERTEPTFAVGFLDNFFSPFWQCAVRYEVVGSSVVEGGPFEFELGGETWNVWQWSIEEVDDDCAISGTEADLEVVDSLALPSTIYMAIGEPEGIPDDLPNLSFGVGFGDSEPLAGIGIWQANDGDHSAPPQAGAGAFLLTGIVPSIVDWDGREPFVTGDGTPAEGIDSLQPGDLLRNVVVPHSGTPIPL